MLKKYNRKALSVAFSLALIVSLFAGLTINASAANYSMTTVHNNSTNLASGDTVTIGSSDEMGYFDTYVNGGKNTTGVTFDLTSNIALSGTWTPVGGVSLTSGDVPTGIGFSGIFDGQGHTISGLNVSQTVSSTANAAYGLFGYVNGGVVGNLTVSGSVTVTGSGSDVGGVVGYTNYKLYNCTSNVTISATGCSNVGGVVGCVENKTTTNLNAQYCANTGAVTGMGRVGGVIGGSYTGTSNVDSIDRCYNTGAVTSTQTSKTYAGGVVGYACGAISNCYNTGDLTCGGTTVKCYMGGIAGILVDYNTLPSSMTNCYSTASFYNYMPGYPEYLWGSSDKVADTVTNCHWVANSTLSPSQPLNYVTATNVTAVNLSDLTPSNLGSAYTGSAPATLDFSHAMTTLSSGTPSTTSDTDNTSMIFLDGTASTNGNGSQTNPYNSLASALAALTDTHYIIYITGQVTINANMNISSTVNNATIERSCTYSGNLFNVTGGAVTVSGLTIDGNSDSFTNASGALFWMAGGSLTIANSVTLQNNSTQTNGGAIHIDTGSVTLSGSIIGNSALNGGGVAMYGGSFTVAAAGFIDGNSAHTHGAGVYYVTSASSYTNNGTVNDAVYQA